MFIKIVDNRLSHWVLLTCVLGFSGCVEFKMPATMPWSKVPPEAKPADAKFAEDQVTDAADEEPLPPVAVPNRLSVVWTDTILNQRNKPSIRGFGGRIMFYVDKSNMDDKPAEPLIVDGTLTVYAFGDDNGKGKATKPEKRFVFLPEQLAKHRSKSDIGHSYSVWLPWDEVGGPQRRISLFVRFEPTQGGAVMSDAAPKILPGALPEETVATTTAEKPTSHGSPIEQAAAQRDASLGVVQAGGPIESSGARLQKFIDHQRDHLYSIEPVGYESQAAVKESNKEAMSTVTIDVPAAFVDHSGSPVNAQDTEQTSPHQAESKGATNSQPAAPAEVHPPQSLAQEAAAATSTRYSRSGRFVRDRFRVRKWQAEQLADDPIRRQPHPATWPSDLRPPPQSPPVAEMNLIPQVDTQ
ncbi:hypothetical protein CA54_17890 [Symmachiella macrocystis]|uniref:Uncharacterized protein n=1 Tax=Symmachiella macrocystis TaxID=2527985 RepID=A0A5C6BLA7_9PLAN|nr:hypothetical protein [Symmachiella macrocystis]TWU12963.1 hypothetical protein CA54_17890 [Symmachiella macrocystis]